MKKLVASMALIALVSVGSTACMGRMALSARLGKWNMGVADTKWPRWVVFLALYVIPVYPIVGAIDLVILNSIEFHRGKNPLSGESARAWASHRVEGPNGELALSTLRLDGSIDLAITDAQGREHFVNLAEEDGWYVARDAAGNALARVDESGNLERLGF